jgi:hypothetical protein
VLITTAVFICLAVLVVQTGSIDALNATGLGLEPPA